MGVTWLITLVVVVVCVCVCVRACVRARKIDNWYLKPQLSK